MRQIVPVFVLLLAWVPASFAQVDCEDWGSAYFFSQGTAEEIRRCLMAGADLNARFGPGETPLHRAASWGRDALVIALLAEAGADVNARNSSGMTPLHVAAAPYGRPAIVRALVAAGADMTARNANGDTPLHLSVLRGRPEIAITLLKLGADPKARNGQGRTADPTGRENWSTRTFAQLNDADLIAKCIESGSDVGQRDGLGNTALHHWAAKEDPTAAVLLIKAGADASAVNHLGSTPLH
ncbi:MAG: ankyrin repeat domain-containing protein [Bacteroidota bacterium]|nr:ankyrin repeat domain-containing protein [Bacteroidota bacterium]